MPTSHDRLQEGRQNPDCGEYEGTENQENAASYAAAGGTIDRTPFPNRQVRRFLASKRRSGSTSSPHLDKAIAGVWRLVVNGIYTEQQAQKTIAAIMAERDGHAAPDEKTRKQRHWSGSGIVPEPLRSALTPAKQAVAAFILWMIKKTGVCEKYYGYIAKCTGYSVKTVQRTIAIMERFGFTVQRGRFDGRRCSPTVIKTTCGKMYNWIRRNATSGLDSLGKLITETFFVRPAPFEGLAKRREAPS